MKPRPGYTLLEVVLALGISLLLVAALYVALDVQFRYMQTGRNAVAEAELARGLLRRVGTDVRLGLAALPKNSASGTASSTSQTTGSTTSTTTTTTGGSSTSSNPSSSTTNTQTAGQFNMGVIGSDTQVMLYLNAVPRYNRNTSSSQTGVSDLRRVTYELIPGSGLARIEARLPSNDGNWQDEPPVIVAAEVMQLQFRYYDGSQGQWSSSWDGTTSGPPQAVEITMAILPPAETAVVGSRPRQPTTYRTVVAIPSASIPAEVVDDSSGGSP